MPVRTITLTPTPSATLAATPTLTATLTATPLTPTATPQATPSFVLESIIPNPVSVTPAAGMFYLTSGMKIFVDPTSPEVKVIGQYLADLLNPATGYAIGLETAQMQAVHGSISMTLRNADASLGGEGYKLEITPDQVKITANQPAGLFHAVQTIRQLLPAAIESVNLQPGPWVLAVGTITDYPRFAYRGVMLDVVRHFFTVEEVKRYIDLLALYKINALHLHLTDDQGWRIEIKSWPNLTTIGGQTEIGGGSGGFYTQADYTQIVAYAQSRYITVVPEIDMPGHVTAALASYPELNCSAVTPEISTTIHVRYSSLCIARDSTYQFMQDVLREVAALTPGPFIDIGGDEAGATSLEDYIAFVQRAQETIEAQGKQAIGWEEIAQTQLSPGSVAQHWNLGVGYIPQVLEQGNRVIMSPVEKTYINLKYDPSTQLGPDVGLFLNVDDAYDWDPLKVAAGVTEKVILGIEAPLWTETLQSMADIEFMTFPRLPGYAEIGWTPQTKRDWADYRLRLAEQGPRLSELGVNFFHSPEIPWK